jgi:hypothetical protein
LSVIIFTGAKIAKIATYKNRPQATGHRQHSSSTSFSSYSSYSLTPMGNPTNFKINWGCLSCLQKSFFRDRSFAIAKNSDNAD